MTHNEEVKEFPTTFDLVFAYKDAAPWAVLNNELGWAQNSHLICGAMFCILIPKILVVISPRILGGALEAFPDADAFRNTGHHLIFTIKVLQIYMQCLSEEDLSHQPFNAIIEIYCCNLIDILQYINISTRRCSIGLYMSSQQVTFKMK